MTFRAFSAAGYKGDFSRVRAGHALATLGQHIAPLLTATLDPQPASLIGLTAQRCECCWWRNPPWSPPGSRVVGWVVAARVRFGVPGQRRMGGHGRPAREAPGNVGRWHVRGRRVEMRVSSSFLAGTLRSRLN